MRFAIIDAFEENHIVEAKLKKVMEKSNSEYYYFKLKDMNIRRCTGCGACGVKIPGKCAISDDMQQIFKALARCDTIILASKLSFGGYSSLLKKAVDRFMPLGLPLYFVKEGRLYHPGRYGKKYYVGIAVAEEKLQGQEENYEKIVKGNAMNLQYVPKSLILYSKDESSKIGEEIGKLLQEIINNPVSDIPSGRKKPENKLNTVGEVNR